MARFGEPSEESDLPKIAVFAGPTATVLNSPPLVTSEASGGAPGLGALRAQRLAAPVVAYIEPMSAHPLERDSAELYGPPNCLLDATGREHPAPARATAPASGSATAPQGLRAVHRVVLRPEDGLYFLPYAATTAQGEPWRGSGLRALAGDEEQRQTFFPDASRLYEEIDRFGLDETGRAGTLSRRAQFSFFRPIPSSGYRHGLASNERTDRDPAASGEAIAPEVRGTDYFPYYPRHLRADPPGTTLALATNMLQSTLGSGEYAGGQWLEGTPAAEESLYWFSLLLDITVPLVGQVAQRPHGSLSSDGGRNVVDGVAYIAGGAWAGPDGGDAVGVVLIADQVVYAAREVMKTDDRPGNYVATGGFGGVVGRVDNSGRSVVTYLPTSRFTHRSELNLSALPAAVVGHGPAGASRRVEVLDGPGKLRPEAMPVVTVLTYGRYADHCCGPHQVGSWVEHATSVHPLSGIVGEGANPYGHFDAATDRALRRAAFCGVPVAKCGRGATRGFVPRQPGWAISANNLTASKARMLLMAALLKFGALPAAADPSNPSPEEEAALAAAVGRYQAVFDTH